MTTRRHPQMVGHHLEHTVAEALHGQAQGQHFVGAGKGARDMDALLVLVQQGAGGGESRAPAMTPSRTCSAISAISSAFGA